MSNTRIETIRTKLEKRHLKIPQPLTLFDDRPLVRTVEDIAKRAVVCAVVSRCAYDLFETEDIAGTQKEYADIVSRFGLENELFANEKAVLYDDFDEDLCNSVCWQYEAVIALLWALSMIETIDDADEPSDLPALLNEVFEKVTAFSSFEAFLSHCALRGEEELADMYQLYWHYHWNTVDGMIFGRMPESICFDVVYERRRALQWLVYSDESDAGDWEIRMDT